MVCPISDSLLIDYTRSLGNIKVGKVVELTAIEDIIQQNTRKNQNLIITYKPLNNNTSGRTSFWYSRETKERPNSIVWLNLSENDSSKSTKVLT